MSNTVTLAFHAGLSSDELEMLKGVSDHIFSSWSVMKKTESGEVEQSHLHLSSIDQQGNAYTATLRVNLGGLLGEGLQRRNSQGVIENRWAYAQLTAKPGDELFESFERFYEQALDFPRNDNGSIQLEKGNGASLASLVINQRGTFLITILKEMVRGSANVEDSGYFKIDSYDVFGDCAFEARTSLKNNNKLAWLKGNAELPAKTVRTLPPVASETRVGLGFNGI
jgi:hypothetical protein